MRRSPRAFRSPPGAQTIDRQCASGLTAIAAAAKQIIVDGMEVVVAGGQDNISAVQKRYLEWVAAEKDPNVTRQVEHAYMPMLLTAENVARKYKISRDAQDAYALSSQQRTAQAQAEGRFDAEIVPITATMAVTDKATNEVSYKEVTLAKDEGNRPDTTAETPRGARARDRRRNGDRRQREPALRRRVRLRADGGEARAEARPRAARPLPRHDGRRQRAGGNGHRSDLRGAEAPAAARPRRSATSACGS